MTMQEVTIVVGFLMNVGAIAYGAGTMSNRIKNMEATLRNGINKRIDNLALKLDQHGESLAAMQAKCKERHRE